MQEQSLHHRALPPSSVIRPLASTRNAWSRQKTVRPKKLATNTAKDKASRTRSNHGLAGERPSAAATARAVAHLRTQEINTKMHGVKPKPASAAAAAEMATG